jgi:predicted CoA-binding protein
MTTRAAVDDFLAQRTLAVVGVSRKGQKFGNMAFRELKTKEYQIFPVNPNAEEVEGDHAYPDLRSIPGGVEAVVIATAPEHAQATMEEAADLGIHDVWMHRSFGKGSVSPAATAWGRPFFSIW